MRVAQEKLVSVPTLSDFTNLIGGWAVKLYEVPNVLTSPADSCYKTIFKN